jgi:HK97 family phage prohead protease
MKRERRVFNFELRSTGDAPVIVGHAAVFNRAADLGLFKEVVSPGAFRDSIGTDDVRALFNHDANYVLGRNTAGTLRMVEDERGLAVEIDPPNTQWARDLMVSMQRGDITQMSFGFTVPDGGAVYERKSNTRTLNKVQLFDVSPVTYPAYTQTDVTVRSAQDIYNDIAKHESSASFDPEAVQTWLNILRTC